MISISALEKKRKQYKPKLPPCLQKGIMSVNISKGKPTNSVSDQKAIKKAFANTYGMPVLNFKSGVKKAYTGKSLSVGVVLSGGQAPGGHNVIAGIFDGIKNLHPQSKLYGFLGGPSGLIDGNYVSLNAPFIDKYRNTGGFDIIGSGRTKLESEEQFQSSLAVAKKLKLDAIVVIGGDDSNTNAAVLAEFIKTQGSDISVIGVPKTIDGDLKNKNIPTSFGFDTAVKTYSELVGNINRDSLSAKKYWHFIKLMGRSASHIALEVGLQTQPNLTLISEEVEAKNMSVMQIVTQISDIVSARAAKGKNYGVILVPEGLIEFIPSMKSLISELNDNLARYESQINAINDMSKKVAKVITLLNKSNASVFKHLPERIQHQLLLDRDPHGNVQVSRIDTEILLIELVQQELGIRKSQGSFKGKFSAQHHFFGYEGRCAPPSNFDADYTYSLGYSAVTLIKENATGYMASVSNLSAGPRQWKAGGIPITMLLNMEKRHGAQKPVIKKALVELKGAPFMALKKIRANCEINDNYVYPGPIQYFGPEEVCDATTITLKLEKS